MARYVKMLCDQEVRVKTFVLVLAYEKAGGWRSYSAYGNPLWSSQSVAVSKKAISRNLEGPPRRQRASLSGERTNDTGPPGFWGRGGEGNISLFWMVVRLWYMDQYVSDDRLTTPIIVPEDGMLPGSVVDTETTTVDAPLGRHVTRTAEIVRKPVALQKHPFPLKPGEAPGLGGGVVRDPEDGAPFFDEVERTYTGWVRHGQHVLLVGAPVSRMGRRFQLVEAGDAPTKPKRTAGGAGGVPRELFAGCRLKGYVPEEVLNSEGRRTYPGEWKAWLDPIWRVCQVGVRRRYAAWDLVLQRGRAVREELGSLLLRKAEEAKGKGGRRPTHLSLLRPTHLLLPTDTSEPKSAACGWERDVRVRREWFVRVTGLAYLDLLRSPFQTALEDAKAVHSRSTPIPHAGSVPKALLAQAQVG